MTTVAASLQLFICWSIGLFLLGVCVGGFIIYKIEEKEFKAMTEQCEALVIEEQRLRQEREEFNDHKMMETIDDVPEYLRDKYYISEKQDFTDSDEDLEEVYV